MENDIIWDEAYDQLKEELGREPSTSEIQKRMLKLFFEGSKNENGQNCRDN